MYRFIVSFLLFSAILLASYVVRSEYDYQVVKDLKSTWKAYDEPSGYFVPFINNGTHQSVYCELDLGGYKQFNLELQVPSRHSIYINNQLVYLSEHLETIVWSIDSLVGIYNEPKVILTIFNHDLNASFISTYIIKKEGDRSSKVEPSLTWDFRDTGYKMNVLTLSAFFILSLIVVYRTNSYRLFREYFSVSKALMVRQRFDLIGAHAPLSPVTLVFIMLYAVMVGATVLYFKLINLWSMDYLGWIELSQDPIFYGVQITFVAFLFMVLKYPLIAIVAGVFNFQKFSETHYFAYLRLSLISILAVLGTSIAISILSDQWLAEAWFMGRFIITTLLLVRLSSMALILNNKYNFSKLHLFTYLCSLEIIPLCLFLKSLLG